MNDVQVYENELFGKIRIIIIEDKLWFVAKDLTSILGYRETRNMLERLPNETVRDISQREIHKRGLDTDLFSDFGNNSVRLINEMGLYQVICESHKPATVEFKKYIYNDILPAVNKHGVYATNSFIENALNDPDLAIKVFQALKEERTARIKAENETVALQHQVKDQQVLMATYKQSVEFCENVLQRKEAIPVTIIAKDYGMGAIAFNNLLNQLHIQYRIGSTWMLYQAYAGSGYTCSYVNKTVKEIKNDERIGIQTYWTHKGRKFLYDYLKNAGIIPILEQNIAS
jgi:prophage antirepressor-like protein